MTTAVHTTTTNGQAVPRAPRRGGRTSKLLLLAVLLGVLGALLAVFAFRGAVAREGVVALARPLSYGDTIDPTALREVLLPSDTGLATIAWRDVESVIGTIAATDLRVGQTLTPDAVTSTRTPMPGEAVVGIPAEPGHVPTSPLNPRDAVLVVSAGRPSLPATVVRTGETDLSGRRTVDVVVPQAEAEAVALAALDERVVLVLVGRG